MDDESGANIVTTRPHHKRAPSINSQLFVVGGGSTGVTSAQGSGDDDLESASSYGALSDLGSELGSEQLSSFDATEYLYRSLRDAVGNNQSMLDRALVTQAQNSGILKAKSVELQNLGSELSSKLEKLRNHIHGSTQGSVPGGTAVSFHELFGRCQKNLLWCEKHLASLQQHVNDEYPIEYTEAQDQVMSRTRFTATDSVDLEIMQKD